MAQPIYIRCQHCGEQLADRSIPYCPPCNLYLLYRAMPILLGMLMTGQRSLRLQPAYVNKGLFKPQAKLGYDDKTILLWE